MIRYHSKQLAGGTDEKQIMKWANGMVNDKKLKAKKLTSKSLTNCAFYFALLQKVFDAIGQKTGERLVVNEDLIEKDGTPEAKYENARYVIQMARMIGCIIFLTPEDIIERKKDMIFSLLTQLKHASECEHEQHDELPEMAFKEEK